MEHTKVDKYTDIGNMEHSLTFQQTKEHFMKCILTRNVMKNIAKEQWIFCRSLKFIFSNTAIYPTKLYCCHILFWNKILTFSVCQKHNGKSIFIFL